MLRRTGAAHRSESRISSPRRVGQRIIAQAERLRLSAIVIDHVHAANNTVRSLIRDLMMTSDPAYAVPLDGEDLPGRRRVGIVLVDHNAPEALFANQTEVLTLLQGAYASLPPYTTVEAVAELMRQADIGLEDLDLRDEEDRLMAERVLETTDGLMSSMAGLLRMVDLLAMASGGYRPELAMVEGALSYHRQMVQLQSSRGADGTASSFHTVACAKPRPAAQNAKQPTAASKPGGTQRGNPAKLKKLKEKSDSRSVAKATQREMLRRGYSVLPEGRDAAEG